MFYQIVTSMGFLPKQGAKAATTGFKIEQAATLRPFDMGGVIIVLSQTDDPVMKKPYDCEGRLTESLWSSGR